MGRPQGADGLAPASGDNGIAGLCLEGPACVLSSVHCMKLTATVGWWQRKEKGPWAWGCVMPLKFPYLVIKVGVALLLFDTEEGILQSWP